MCLSAIAAAAGVVASLLGLECVSAMEESRTKTWTGRSGGILMLLSGQLLCKQFSVSLLIKILYVDLHSNILNCSLNHSLSRIALDWIGFGSCLHCYELNGAFFVLTLLKSRVKNLLLYCTSAEPYLRHVAFD